MAFDQPLAADSIEEFNLLSAFVRAPLWILGGVLGSRSDPDEDENASLEAAQLMVDKDDDKPAQNEPQNKAPRRIVSYCNDPVPPLAKNDDTMRESDNRRPCDMVETRDNNLSLSDVMPGLRRPSHLSWSDDSGRSLVEYNDEVSLSESFRPWFSVRENVSRLDENLEKWAKLLFWYPNALDPMCMS